MMTRERLKEIINLKDFQKIEKEVVSKEKYFDMARHAELKKISLLPILQSDNFVKLDRTDSYKFSFIMGYVNDIKEYPDYEFVWLQVDKYDKSCNAWLPHILRMYARKKETK